MRGQEFGRLLETERLRRGWTRSKLAVAIGILDDGTALDATQVRRIVEGTRKLDQSTVQRIIEALDLPEEEAWHAAGLWPPDLSLDDYRRLRRSAGTVSPGSLDRARERRRGRDRRRRIAPLELAA